MGKRLLTALVAILALGLALQVPGVAGEGVPKARLISDLAYPATVLVYAEINGEVDTPDWVGIPASIWCLGTGFFVNPHGYLVTCGHVVFAFDNTDPMQDSVVRYYLLYSAALNLVDYLRGQGYVLTSEDVEQIIEYVLTYGRVTWTSLDVYVILGEALGADIEAKGIKARVVAKSPFLEKDVAILKIDLENTPTLPLGDSDKVEMGEEVYAVGYPAAVTFHEMLNPETMLIPSITKGIVSARRKTRYDTPALQTDVEVSYGHSGGPALSGKGEVIGVVNMGSIDPERGVVVAGFNFLVPSNIVEDFLRENGIENERGIADELYEEALALFYAKCYDSAVEKLNELLNVFPYHWYAKKLVAEAQEAMARGERAGSSMELSAPDEAELGEEFSVSGRITVVHESPIPVTYEFPGGTVRVEYTRPDGETIVHTVSVDKDGYFSDTIKVETAGTWKVAAHWTGNDDMEGCSATAEIEVTSPPAGIPIELVAIAGVGIAIAAVAVLFFAKRRRLPPPPPPPPL